MKRVFILFIATFWVVFSNAQEKMNKAGAGSYTATYSSNFKIGNPDYSNKILELWKDWDDNMFDRHDDYMADSLVMMFANGTTVKGKKENMEAAKKYRSSLGVVKSTVHAWVPLKSTDRNEDVVCIWGQEEDTLPDGKVEKRDIHEVWWFNKDGKVVALRQWTAQFSQPK